MSSADYIPPDSFEILLKALMPQNRLALQVAMATGLRIDDVLHIKTADMQKGRFTVKEMKTGKRRRVRIPNALREECLRYAGRFYVFEHRLEQTKPRTRQAVYKDLKRACNLFRVNGLQISPHTARKIYSVCLYDKYNSVDKVRETMKHSDNATTEIYCNADVKTEKATKRKKVKYPL